MNIYIYIYLVMLLMLFSCENRTVKYSGQNDLVVGIQNVVLYENGEFYLELGAGGKEGKYKLENDTVFLKYNEKSENWPDMLLMTDDYFSTIYDDSVSRVIKIKRWNINNDCEATNSSTPEKISLK